MAKINIEFDTVSKDMSAVIDGKKLENVHGASFYNYGGYGGGDDFSCEICTCQRDEENGMATHTRVVASESIDGKKLEDYLVNEDIPEFKIVQTDGIATAEKTQKTSNLVKSVASYFGVDGE